MSARVVLVGAPGSGKTTVGAALAAALGTRFVDLDDALEARCGRSPAAWLRESGEAAFRAVEADALAEVLAEGDGAVVATGGGAVESEESRARLRAEPCVVELRCSPELLVARLTADPADRPLTAAPTLERLEALLARRRPYYDDVATSWVDAGGAVDDVVARLLVVVQ